MSAVPLVLLSVTVVLLGLLVAGTLLKFRTISSRFYEERRYSVLESIQDGMFIVDDRWRFTHVNEKAEELLRATAAELVGRRVEKVLDPLASDLVPELRAVRSSGNPRERTQFFQATNTWIEIRIQPAAREVLVYLRDISANKRAEILLRDSERRLRLLLEQVPALLWTVDLDMRFTSIVGAGLASHGLQESDLASASVERILPDDELRAVALGAIRRVFVGDSERFETFFRGRWMQHHVEPLRSGSGAIIGAIGVALDVTEMKETANHLANLARVDALTQLPNRLALEEAMSATLEGAIRDKRSIGVLFVDLDRFKTINDTLGHRAGDELLRQFALRLRLSVDAGAKVFRSGGDEFIVTVELDQTVSVPMIAADVQMALTEPFFVAGRQLFVSASIGASSYPEDGSTVEELLTRADSAMYRAKYSGRSRVGFFDVANDDAAPYRLRLEQDLHYAILRGELHLLFQPVVDATTSRVVGAEALLRWSHTKHGEILPDEFMGIAEETGLIVQISRWVLRDACQQLAAFRSTENPDFHIAVHLSARDFAETDLADSVRDILQETGVPPDALEIQITESVMIDDIALRTLANLRSMGVRVVVDDFGLTYSSLGYLRRLPISGVKIDRSFVRDINGESYDQAIVRAIIAFARSLDLDIIADGVDSSEESKFIDSLTCERTQGLHFSPPIAAERLSDIAGRLGRR